MVRCSIVTSTEVVAAIVFAPQGTSFRAVSPAFAGEHRGVCGRAKWLGSRPGNLDPRRTFYPTYDYKAVAEEQRRKNE
jgi:hypothetical protein